jgi:hypothetical protein
MDAVYEASDSECYFTNNFLSTCYKISVNKMKLYILCMYRAPNGNLNQFIEQLDSTLLYLGST